MQQINDVNLLESIMDNLNYFLKEGDWNYHLLEYSNGDWGVKNKAKKEKDFSDKLDGEAYTKTFHDGVVVGFVLKKIKSIEHNILNEFPSTSQKSLDNSQQIDSWEILKTISDPYNLKELTLFNRPPSPKPNLKENFLSPSYFESLCYVVCEMISEEEKRSRDKKSDC